MLKTREKFHIFLKFPCYVLHTLVLAAIDNSLEQFGYAESVIARVFVG